MIPDKKAFYQALSYNQYILPPLKDNMVTRQFMINVKTGKQWCLKSSDISGTRVCADPPSRKDLANIVGDVMLNYRSLGEPHDTAFKSTAMLIKKQPPAVHWLLQVLATIDPGNVIFSKGYRKPSKQQQARQVEETMISNADGFFSDLPILGRRSRGKAILSFADPTAKQRAKIDRMESQLLRLNE